MFDCVSTQDIRKQTPLHLASKKGHLKVVQYLVETGKAEVDAMDVSKAAPI